MKSEKFSQYMMFAITLAKKGVGKTSPNPPVGAVIIKNNKIIGKGYHKKAGSIHAEIMALNKADKNACGADIYVTLEPCSTYGKTPPCVDAIINAGIKRVFIGSIDPNSKNKDRSLNIFKQAGIKTEIGILKEKTDELIKPFSVFVNKKRPYYILKSAMSLDGRIACHTGDSKWITSDKSRQFVHKIRNTVDAILIGKNTLLTDNPYLNVRGIKNPNKPIKIVLGYDDNINEDFNIFNDGKEQVKIFVKKGKKIKKKIQGVEIIEIENLGDLSKRLYDLNIMSVLIEGGSKVYESFMEQELIDRYYFFIAPIILGGDKLAVPISFKGKETVKDSLRFQDIEIKKNDEDILIIADNRKKKERGNSLQ